MFANFYVHGNENMNKESHPIPFNVNQSRSKFVRSKNNYGKMISKSGESPTAIRKEYDFSLKTIFLIRQINLEQRLRNSGVTVSFSFAANDCDNKGKLVVQTIAGNETSILDELLKFVNPIDHCGYLSKRICQYLGRCGEMRGLVNRQLQELNINAGIEYIDQSISVVAINSTDHDKAIEMLQNAFDSDSMKLAIEDLNYSQDMEMFLSIVREKLSHPNRIWLETNFDSESSTYIITATGPRKLVVNAMQIITDKQQDYKLINISLTDICIFKTEYLRLFRKDDILELEKKYCCQIEIETIKESDAVTPQIRKAIKIRCCQLYKDEISRQIYEIIDGIIIEKEESISLHSRQGKLCLCNKSKHKLEFWQEDLQCMLILTDHQGYR